MRSFDRPMDFAEQVEGGLAVLQRILLGCTLSAEQAGKIEQAAQRLLTRVRECASDEPTMFIGEDGEQWLTRPYVSSQPTRVQLLEALLEQANSRCAAAEQELERLRHAFAIREPLGRLFGPPRQPLIEFAKTITCPKCVSVSTNAADIAQEYCGNCRAFHADLVKP